MNKRWRLNKKGVIERSNFLNNKKRKNYSFRYNRNRRLKRMMISSWSGVKSSLQFRLKSSK